MYNVSDDFKQIMKSPAQYRRLHGTIGDVEFTQKNILQGTFIITNQCSDTSNIQIGQAYVGSLQATFRGLDIPRKNWKGKEIIPYHGLMVGEQFEDVLLGHYFVDSAKWTRAGIVVTAYDVMSNFDKSLSLSSSSGTPYDFIIVCCEACKVEFGMTEEEVRLLTNGTQILGIYEENDMETYRDLLSWVAQSTGSNALINREGKLVLKQYSEDIVDTLDVRQRLDGGKFSDFDTFYTGISIVNMNANTTSYYGAEVDDGLTMNLGSNPLLQLGLEETLEEQRRNVLTAIQKINYTSLTISINCPFIYDLMDVIELTDGIVGVGNSIKTCITKYTWKFNGEYEIECVGSDPALASGKSKVDKNIAGLIGQVDANKTITYRFSNVRELDIADTFVEIINIVFTSKERTTALFLAEILLDITANTMSKEISGTATYTNEAGEEVSLLTNFAYQDKTHPIAEINYRLNSEFIDTFVPKQIYHEGSQILTLYYPLLSIPDNMSNEFSVFLKLTDGTGFIDRANINATISGQGLVAAYTEWDGKIDIEEIVSIIEFASSTTATFTVNGITEDIVVAQQNPTPINITETIGLIYFSNDSQMSISGIITESIEVSEIVQQQTVNFSLNEYTTRDENSYIQLRQDYSYVGVDEEIDYGQLNVVDVITSDKQSIEEIKIEVM